MNSTSAQAVLIGLSMASAMGTATKPLSLSQIYQNYGENGIQVPPSPLILSENSQSTLRMIEDLADGTLTLAFDNLVFSSLLGYIFQHKKAKLRQLINTATISKDQAASNLAAAYLVKLALDDIPPELYLTKVWGFCSGISNEFDMTIRKIGHVLGWGSEIHAMRHLGKGQNTAEVVTLALYCVMKYPDDYLPAIRRAANTEGDSDRIASITGAIMGARLGLGEIPEIWHEQLQNRKYILKLAEKMSVEREKYAR